MRARAAGRRVRVPVLLQVDVVMASGILISRPPITSESGPRLLSRVLTFVRGEQFDVGGGIEQRPSGRVRLVLYDSFAALPKL
jgi:hypothetical protein